MSETTVDEVKVEETTTEEVVEEKVEETTEEVEVTETKPSKAKKAKKEKKKKESWFKGLKAEFKKITWPDRKTLVKQTIAVLTCSVLLGAIIAIIDALIQHVIKLIV